MHRVFALLWAAVWLAVPSATPQEARAKVPPGRDPGGVAVGLLCTGIDYTLPAMAARLARDGEGELIGWDLESGDNRPFDRSRGTTPQVWGGDGTAMASAIVEAAGVRLVPIRAVPADPASLARALAFAARTPARIVIVPMQTADRRDWDQFAQAATRFKHLLVIAIAATNETAEPAYPAALGLENVLAVAPQSSSGESQGFGGMRVQVPGAHLALAAVAKAAATILAREPRIETGDLKRRLMQDERPAR